MNRFIRSRLMPAVDPISIRLCQDMSNAAFKCLKNALGLTEECWGILLQIGFTQSINCTLSIAVQHCYSLCSGCGESVVIQNVSQVLLSTWLSDWCHPSWGIITECQCGQESWDWSEYYHHVSLLTWAHISACFSSSHSCWWPMMEPGLQILSQAMVSMAVHLQCFIM